MFKQIASAFRKLFTKKERVSDLLISQKIDFINDDDNLWIFPIIYTSRDFIGPGIDDGSCRYVKI